VGGVQYGGGLEDGVIREMGRSNVHERISTQHVCLTRDYAGEAHGHLSCLRCIGGSEQKEAHLPMPGMPWSFEFHIGMVCNWFLAKTQTSTIRRYIAREVKEMVVKLAPVRKYRTHPRWSTKRGMMLHLGNWI